METRAVVMRDAPGVISALAAGAGRLPPVVGVCGPVGAGKTTLARSLSACVLSTDMYLPDYDAVPYERRDDPELADFERLAMDLETLRAGRAARVPVWSFSTHRREGEAEIAPAPLIVIEGIHALHRPLLLDVAVFVEAPAPVRWARWAHLERSGERGWGVEVARRFFDEVAEPTFARLEGAYRARAHVVVRNEIGVPE